MDRQIELTSLRTANSKTFDLGAGKKQVTVTMHRQHYMDGSELKDIDTKWESEVGFGEKVQKADYHLTYKDRTVRFGFSTGVYVEYHMPCDMVASGSELKGQISKDVSIRYLSTPDGVKMEIVLEKCPLVAPTYTIPITLSGCTLTSDMLFMADGKAVGQIPSPYMTDGKDEIGEVAISLGKGGLAITPDFKWLQGAVYPVVIDPTTTFVVGAGANDGYRGAGIYFIAYSPFGRIGYANGGTNHIYCRFPTVGIPKGYTITSAVLQEKALSSLSETDCHTAIYLNSADNAVAPTNYTTYDALSKTIAYSSWTMPSMVSGTWYDSPDFSAAVQEVINRAGWASGNALMVMHEDNGAAGHREVFLYEQNATYAPKLVIEYTEGGGGDVTISPPHRISHRRRHPPNYHSIPQCHRLTPNSNRNRRGHCTDDIDIPKRDHLRTDSNGDRRRYTTDHNRLAERDGFASDRRGYGARHSPNNYSTKKRDDFASYSRSDCRGHRTRNYRISKRDHQSTDRYRHCRGNPANNQRRDQRNNRSTHCGGDSGGNPTHCHGVKKRDHFPAYSDRRGDRHTSCGDGVAKCHRLATDRRSNRRGHTAYGNSFDGSGHFPSDSRGYSGGNTACGHCLAERHDFGTNRNSDRRSDPALNHDHQRRYDHRTDCRSHSGGNTADRDRLSKRHRYAAYGICNSTGRVSNDYSLTKCDNYRPHR